MDPRTNPYSPGAGSRPPELAGRDEIIERASINLDRLRNGLQARSVVLYGLRGVGKTVLLNTIVANAEASGFITVSLEAPEDGSLPQSLIPPLHAALRKLSIGVFASDALKAAKRKLLSFSRVFRVKYEGFELELDLEALSGDLAYDLGEVLFSIGEAAKSRNTALLISIDELQYVRESDLRALITSLHQISQKQQPVFVIAAGLPQLVGQMGEAKSYAERLFVFELIGPLDTAAATDALCKPAARLNVDFEELAVSKVLSETKGYPYFIQEWGRHCWNKSQSSPVTAEIAELATDLAQAELDQSFFRVRLDQLTPIERRYMRAMAELGAGPHRSGDIAAKLGRKVTSVAPIRSALIKKGMIYSPNHGDTAFTVPLFDAFMKRTVSDMNL
ncbi:MAG: ATP-binding protein [Methylocystis sp.]|nr:ATP-binding protein [Methylocystis sp.]MCA3582783.1 ATP-binding protein [Methylocystis sp.]MCA3588499.1 ATP-binding protein [Methylocystis sp.]MCA3592080.1 ATP-binding protein [Methylocystis sp.]